MFKTGLPVMVVVSLVATQQKGLHNVNVRKIQNVNYKRNIICITKREKEKKLRCNKWCDGER